MARGSVQLCRPGQQRDPGRGEGHQTHQGAQHRPSNHQGQTKTQGESLTTIKVKQKLKVSP